MTYNVEITNTGRFAVVSGDWHTVHIFQSEFAAQTAADALNRANYEPVIDPYAPVCGRWDARRGKPKAIV